ncbi:hypothetical protein JCM3770_005587 [Rhodotorula araucariae]
MTAPLAPRRLAVLAGLCVLCVVVVWHASRSRASLSSGRLLSSLGASGRTSPYALNLAHPSEEDAVALVAAVGAFALVANQTQPAKVAVCAVATHEEQFLPEWLTWHRLAGVERFYLFDNAPSQRMRNLLRPWIDEGAVVLYELDYERDVDIGSVYQAHVLRLCERDVLAVTPWASHHDVDEFLLADAPGWTAPLPARAESTVSGWTYPLHARFDALLNEATCVPVLRLPFQNYGVQQIAPGELVTDLQTVRDRVGPNFHTYGKSFIHSEGPDGEKNNAGWMGPHSCRSPPGTVILDAHGNELVQEGATYPYAGLPLPQEGLLLFHYVQRSVADCYSKFHVLASTPHDWRTRDGLAGCARNYVPLDRELATAEARAELEALPQGKELASRPESWRALFVRDVRARDGWVGRMTRAVLDEWRARGGRGDGARWYWEPEPGSAGEDAAGDDEPLGTMVGVVQIKGVGKALPA